MKQLLFLSGKGGTGKTTIASAFIQLSNAKAYADCDVDAPNLHLTYKQYDEPKYKNFYGLPKAYINPQQCIMCDLCRQNCHFDAIEADIFYSVNSFACEGCGVCKAVCPVKAITFIGLKVGELKLYKDDVALFSTAQLKMGSGNSGMLVSEVKKQLKSAANVDLQIIDGSPGIGCPVIASISGVDFVLIVTEPTVSGISDMGRIIETAHNFQVKIAVCINKYDINIENTKKIEDYCEKQKIPIVGKIPFDLEVIHSINKGLSIVDTECEAGYAIKDIFINTMKIIRS